MRKYRLQLILFSLFIFNCCLSSCIGSWLIKDELNQEEKRIKRARLDVKNDQFPICLPNMNIEITHTIPLDLNSFIKEDFAKNIIDKEKSKYGTILINAESIPLPTDSIGRIFTVLLLNKDNKMIRNYVKELRLSGKEYCNCNYLETKEIKNISDPILVYLYMKVRSEIKGDIIDIKKSLEY